MRRSPIPFRVCCFVVALGVALSGGEAFGARGGKPKKKTEPSEAASTAAPAGKKRPDFRPAKSDSLDPGGGSSPTNSGAPASRGPARIDFDDRLIQGQTNKSGAVYLYERKELKTRSMIKMRDSFREETVGSVYDG